jgi:uncharacterized protein (DUF1697 family)
LSLHIALLRAVNVGGTAKVPMAELRALAEGLGFTGVQTLLQSGNLVFRSPADNAADLENQLEAALETQLKVKTTVIVRSAKAWTGLIADNPFAAVAKADPGHLLVMPLKTRPAAHREAALQAAIKGRETARVIGEAAYIVYPDGIGRSKLTIAVIEAKLGVKGTARNWNTVGKLAALTSA